MNFAQRYLAFAVSFSLLFFGLPQRLPAAPSPSLQEDYANLSNSDLDALVAPIALYPDALVAQVLGAATYPDQVVEASDYIKANPNLTGEPLQRGVEQKGWDSAVRPSRNFLLCSILWQRIFPGRLL